MIKLVDELFVANGAEESTAEEMTAAKPSRAGVKRTRTALKQAGEYGNNTQLHACKVPWLSFIALFEAAAIRLQSCLPVLLQCAVMFVLVTAVCLCTADHLLL